MKETYSIEDLAAMTGFSERTVRRYLASGQLKGEKRDGVWEFTPEQFDAFLRQNMVRQSLEAKDNAFVYDFLLLGRKPAPSACAALDLPVAQAEEAALRERLMDSINRLELACRYRYRDGMARLVLSGPPERVGRLLAEFAA